MQIQIGIDIVLILAFVTYLSVITGWNSKNKAAYIKQFRFSEAIFHMQIRKTILTGCLFLH